MNDEARNEIFLLLQYRTVVFIFSS